MMTTAVCDTCGATVAIIHERTYIASTLCDVEAYVRHLDATGSPCLRRMRIYKSTSVTE